MKEEIRRTGKEREEEKIARAYEWRSKLSHRSTLSVEVWQLVTLVGVWLPERRSPRVR